MLPKWFLHISYNELNSKVVNQLKVAESSPIIYLIRHGEKPPKNPDGSDPDGLSARGVERAQGLRQVFAADSPYGIKYIIAEEPKDDGSRARSVETITPLAQDLGITPDTSISRDDAKGAAKAAKQWEGPGNVLVCWEHGVLGKIVKELGVKEKMVYPGDRFDIIWAVKKPYEVCEVVGSVDVPGLDTGVLPVTGGGNE